MRWRPEEDDQEHHDGLPPVVWRSVGDVVADHGPTDEHRHAASRAAPNHVLPRAALEPLRVDEDVERVGQDDEERRQPGLTEQTKPQHTDDQQCPCKDGGLLLGYLVTDQRAGARTPHFLVDVVVGHHVERVCGAGAHPASEESCEDEPNVNFAAVSLEHRRDCGDQE